MQQGIFVRVGVRPLNKELSVRLTTYTMPQIEVYKELEMRIPIR
ncbi:hypothetical protein [Paenibacillus tianmuensis]|nr:hypothetical protein [Paenibacillus tianmuensis]